MPNVNNEIERYWIYHLPASDKTPTHILCYAPGSSSPNAHLVFYKDGVSIPASTCGSNSVIWLRCAAFQFHEIIETLRREKPVFIYWNESSNRGFIYTGQEPVGEEELDDPGS